MIECKPYLLSSLSLARSSLSSLSLPTRLLGFGRASPANSIPAGRSRIRINGKNRFVRPRLLYLSMGSFIPLSIRPHFFILGVDQPGGAKAIVRVYHYRRDRGSVESSRESDPSNLCFGNFQLCSVQLSDLPLERGATNTPPYLTVHAHACHSSPLLFSFHAHDHPCARVTLPNTVVFRSLKTLHDIMFGVVGTVGREQGDSHSCARSYPSGSISHRSYRNSG